LQFNEDKNQALFGVFDGHGGKEVALFTEKHFTELLKSNPKYQE
jgi:serine/threonine protein phosphatase PrpC